MTLPVEIQARMDDIRAEIEGAGAELIDLLFFRSHQRSILTFLVDKPGGITLDECAKLNQRLGAFFDRMADTGQAEGAFFQGRYLLEVSSPGLDRPFKTPKDFGRAINETIRVVCQPAKGGSASGGNGAVSHGPWVGKLSSVSELGIELEGKDGVKRMIPFEDIAKAAREIGWKH